MKLKLTALTCILLGTSACTTLSAGGEKVEIIKVTTNKADVEEAEAKLKKRGCKYIKNIEASVGMGSGPVGPRLKIGLKNKTAEVGGNAVISSLKAYTAMPIYTKGKVYNCPDGLKSEEV